MFIFYITQRNIEGKTYIDIRNQIFFLYFLIYTLTGKNLLNQPEISNKKVIKTKV